MSSSADTLLLALDLRKKEKRYRQLSTQKQLIDFSSNDYLGLAGSTLLKEKITEELSKFADYKNGSSGSRLLSGNTGYAEQLESKIADYHGAEAALIFNSGYDANLGLLSCIATRNDTILYDELCHASIIDGIRLSLATAYKFSHNDINDLEEKIKRGKGNIFVVVESVYSMDGDFAPLPQLIDLYNQYGIRLIIDEAHATGIFGEQGRGRAYEFRSSIFARVFTYGKAFGLHGASVAGSVTLKNYLINYARSFIYSTALPFHSLASICCAYDLVKMADKERSNLFELIMHFQSQTKNRSHHFIASSSAIQGVIIPGNETVKTVALQLQEKGFDVRPVLSPTVSEGKERIRICLHSFNTEAQINSLINVMLSEVEALNKLQ